MSHRASSTLATSKGPSTPGTTFMDLLSQWSDKEYWRQLCPHLTISDDNTSTASDNGYTEHKPQLIDKQLQRRLVEDGYALIDVQCNNDLRNRVAQSISDIESRYLLPATFALLFDETWQLAFQSQQFLLFQNKILHPDMKFNFDMLAWHIDPTRNQVGFSPHRDRQPDTSEALLQSFYVDGQAKYVTHWIALTDANPNNSCLCKWYLLVSVSQTTYLNAQRRFNLSLIRTSNCRCHPKTV
jgi:hypothetical protein